MSRLENGKTVKIGVFLFWKTTKPRLTDFLETLSEKTLTYMHNDLHCRLVHDFARCLASCQLLTCSHVLRLLHHIILQKSLNWQQGLCTELLLICFRQYSTLLQEKKVTCNVGSFIEITKKYLDLSMSVIFLMMWMWES